MKKLVTHNGSFHSDDIFATAVLSLILHKEGESFEITRTRDEEIIKNGDYVFDVGGIYDEEKNRFDHHQVGGAGKREGGIEYASFGLVWKKYGVILCGGDKIAQTVDKRLVAPIDAGDNGIDLVENKYDVLPYYIQNLFGSMTPTWKEEETDIDKIFLKCVEIAKEILKREIIQAISIFEAGNLVTEIYNNTQDKRIIVLDKVYPWGETLNNFSLPLYVIYPRDNDNFWGVKAIRENPRTFKNRKDLPQAWAGLRDEELQQVSGVPDAVFCHRGLFMCVAKSKEGAIKLAQIALES